MTNLKEIFGKIHKISKVEYFDYKKEKDFLNRNVNFHIGGYLRNKNEKVALIISKSSNDDNV